MLVCYRLAPNDSLVFVPLALEHSEQDQITPSARALRCHTKTAFLNETQFLVDVLSALIVINNVQPHAVRLHIIEDLVHHETENTLPVARVGM